MANMLDPKLEAYATPTQWKCCLAIEEHGSGGKASQATGYSKSFINRCLQEVKKKAARQGYDPDHDLTHPVPDGLMLKGVSTLYNKDGDLTAQWVKSEADKQRQEELIRESIDAMMVDLPKLPPVPLNDQSYNADLCHFSVLFV